jgi:hypothetical protein
MMRAGKTPEDTEEDTECRRVTYETLKRISLHGLIFEKE